MPHDPNLDSIEFKALERRISARLFGTDEPPVTIGRFPVIAALGRGGMGVVYSARDDTLGREVAIKLIPHVQRRRERDRLLAEARALARLAHPNVVHVYEVGESGDDVFIVMELVRGVNFERWLAAAPRTRPQILAAICDAGRGIAAAHAAGLIHRDIKPANILVGADGRVRIADFGLARPEQPGPTLPSDEPPAPVSAPDTASTPTLPRTADPAGTPAYMSPEHLTGETDARSDQFSLCVTLYEALYGRRPFDLTELRSASPLRFAPARGHVPGWLRRILARGLSFRPADRFPSVAALVAALEGTPRRRSYVVVALATLTTAAALAAAASPPPPPPGLACVDIQDDLHALWNDERRAAIERAVLGSGLAYAARTWERFAAGVDRYIADLSAAACTPPIHDLCIKDRLRGLGALLQRAARAEPGELARLDDLANLLPPPSRCSELNPGPSEGIAAGLDDALALRLEGRSLEARVHLDRLVDDSITVGDGPGEVAALHLRGQIEAFDLGDGNHARQTLDLALDRATDLADPSTWAILRDQARLCAEYDANVDTARDRLRRARHAARDLDSPLVTADLDDLDGYVAGISRDFDLALSLQRRALVLRQRHLPPDHRDILESRRQVAMTLAISGHLDEALADLRALTDELATRFGATHPRTAMVEFSTGLLLVEYRRFADAKPLLQRARAVFAELDGPDRLLLARIDVHLGWIALNQDDLVTAAALSRAARSFFEAHLPPHYSGRILALATLSEVCRIQERYEEALALTRTLLEIPPNLLVTYDRTDALLNAGDYLCLLGRCSEALGYYNDLLQIYTRSAPERPSDRAYPLQGLGRGYIERAEHRLAEPLLHEALTLLRQDPDAPPSFVAEVARLQALCLRKLGERAKARALEKFAATLEATAPAR